MCLSFVAENSLNFCAAYIKLHFSFPILYHSNRILFSPKKVVNIEFLNYKKGVSLRRDIIQRYSWWDSLMYITVAMYRNLNRNLQVNLNIIFWYTIAMKRLESG
jgi:hypothetical protein